MAAKSEPKPPLPRDPRELRRRVLLAIVLGAPRARQPFLAQHPLVPPLPVGGRG